MIFRELAFEDVGGVMPLAEEHFYAVKMDKRGHRYNYATAKTTILLYQASPHILTYVMEEKGKFRGIIAFSIYNSMFDSTIEEAGELLWYGTSPRITIKMFDEMETLLLSKKVNIRIGIPKDETVKNFLERKGYIMTEVIMSKINNHNKEEIENV